MQNAAYVNLVTFWQIQVSFILPKATEIIKSIIVVWIYVNSTFLDFSKKIACVKTNIVGQ